MGILKRRGVFFISLLCGLLMLAACDQQRIEQLEEGLATEADVRAKWGEPEKIWDGEAGSKIFEYNRQPQGHRNYMITIGADGKMSALRQVLNERNFAKVQPGMRMEELRKLLGKPAKTITYPLKPNETYYTWKYLTDSNNTEMQFSAVLDSDLKVIRTETMREPESGKDGNRGG